MESMRFNRFAAVAALALSLGAAAPAKADLVIEGRAAQALHCVSMLLVISVVLNEEGYLSPRDVEAAMTAAVLMLEHVPGTQNQKMRAVEQRSEKIVRTRSLLQLAKEFDSTARFCERNFL
ncbi:hypothetical protein [Neotabrizicola sp. VNH66]|uniref:hypothetical protein n=1 Tax=Neotabrizicola sp. VNH66 TaxID=3400918 RepID=UPI003C0BE2D6